MLGSQILEVAIGLGFTYLLLSIFASGLNEWFSSLMAYRSKDLEAAIRNLLSEPSRARFQLTPPVPIPQIPIAPTQSAHAGGRRMASALLAHPLVSNLGAPKLVGTGYSNPSYIDPKTFTSVLFDLLVPSIQGQHSLVSIRSSIQRLQNAELRDTLLPLIDRAAGNVDQARQNIESWFNEAMDRLSGLYKRRAHVFTFMVGLVLVLLLNVDTIRVARELWVSPTLRAGVTEAARTYVEQRSPSSQQTERTRSIATDLKTLSGAYEKAGLPVGWVTTDVYQNIESIYLETVFGWFITALAISFGAPFWFDFLNKTLNLNARLTGPKPALAKK